jgi:hypothetical protein
MVENPIDLFHVHESSTVSDANLNVTGIDEGDSAGGRLDSQIEALLLSMAALCSAVAATSSL